MVAAVVYRLGTGGCGCVAGGQTSVDAWPTQNPLRSGRLRHNDHGKAGERRRDTQTQTQTQRHRHRKRDRDRDRETDRKKQIERVLPSHNEQIHWRVQFGSHQLFVSRHKHKQEPLSLSVFTFLFVCLFVVVVVVVVVVVSKSKAAQPTRAETHRHREKKRGTQTDKERDRERQRGITRRVILLCSSRVHSPLRLRCPRERCR